LSLSSPSATALDRPLDQLDAEVAHAIADELVRQRSTLEMIASEDFAPSAVLQAQGSVLTNKYAEGYPGRRYYGGCEHVDVVERLAIERVKVLFGAAFANVQPHSGAQANAAAMAAVLEPGDTILGLDLAHGGHLTHGMRINFSGRLYDVAAYHVDPFTGLVDMAEVERLAKERAETDHRGLVGLPPAAGLRRVPVRPERARRAGARLFHRFAPLRRADRHLRADPARAGRGHPAGGRRRVRRVRVAGAFLVRRVPGGVAGGRLRRVPGGCVMRGQPANFTLTLCCPERVGIVHAVTAFLVDRAATPRHSPCPVRCGGHCQHRVLLNGNGTVVFQ
jgi:hypothetical protein